uniref:Uncharacterized protein n=1 Tax=Rhizophora mucronata TaxID=61149 RepID=A0A2P2LJD9_RHIMU
MPSKFPLWTNPIFYKHQSSFAMLFHSTFP